MSRRIKHRLVRRHLIYTTDELARLLGVHKNTIRHWVGRGLTPASTDRPILFHGGTVADFLRDEKAKAKRACAPGEMYCLRCREPRKPAGDMADYIPMTATGGNLRGLCPVCDALMHRRTSLRKLAGAVGDLDVKFTQEPRHIMECGKPCLNCDSNDEAKT